MLNYASKGGFGVVGNLDRVDVQDADLQFRQGKPRLDRWGVYTNDLLARVRLSGSSELHEVRREPLFLERKVKARFIAPHGLLKRDQCGLIFWGKGLSGHGSGNVRPNVRAKLTTEVCGVSLVRENVRSTADQAYTACRSGSA